jgi:ribonuclease P protein component
MCVIRPSETSSRRTGFISVLATLKVRAEFLAVRGGTKASVPSCLVEARARIQASNAGPLANGPRFGFTITKKLGNAVTRNRIRRRLKAALSQLATANAEPGYDYVVVARSAAFDRPFADIVADLTRALAIVHGRAQQKSSARPESRNKPRPAARDKPDPGKRQP